MKQYLDVLHDILANGREKESGRANMPNTIGLSRATILMEDIYVNFPLLTTKKMFWKGIVEELLWFLRGETNIKPLVDKGVNIWNGDAYRWYKDHYVPLGAPPMTMEEFLEMVKAGQSVTVSDPQNPHPYDKYKNYYYGDLDKVYGYQWRNQNGVDQIKDIYEDLKKNPYGRYKILDAWNKKDFPEMALPPCHLLYQFIVRPMTIVERLEFYEPERLTFDESEERHEYLDALNVPKYFLDMNMYQRSCDTFLGVPFNLASMSLLLLIMAKAVGMVAGDAFWIGGDTHLYVNHIPMVNEQLSREPKDLPRIVVKKELNSFEDILTLKYEDFELIGYNDPHPAIKAELFTGFKKL